MSFQAWLNSVGGVGYKKGDVDIANDLTGVQTYFDPARPIYWDVRKAGPIRGPDGKPIEEVSQVAAMSPDQINELLIRLIPLDIDPSTQLDRREPMRLKLKSAIDTLTNPAEERRRKSDGGISWADDAELADEDLDISAEQIVRRSQMALRKQRQQKREDTQREVREANGPRDASKGKGWAPRGEGHLAAAWEASIKPGITPGVGLVQTSQIGRPMRESRWNTSSLNGVLGHDEAMLRPPSASSNADRRPTGKPGQHDHRLGKGHWLGPEVDRVPLGGAPELEAAWIASVGPPKYQVVAARNAQQYAKEHGEEGHWVREGRTEKKRWVHDHEISREHPVPHDDNWANAVTGDDMDAHGHFSELHRAQARNARWVKADEEEREAAYFGQPPPARGRGGRSSRMSGGDDRPQEEVAIVRDAAELRKAVAKRHGAPTVELAAGVVFILQGKPLAIKRSVLLRGPAEGGKKASGSQPKLVSRGAGFVAVEASGVGVRVVLDGLRVETGGGRSQGAALKVTTGCSLTASYCTFTGSVAACGQQTVLHLLRSKVVESPYAGFSVTDGAHGVLSDSSVEGSCGDGLYVSGDGVVAEQRRRALAEEGEDVGQTETFLVVERSQVRRSGWNGVWAANGGRLKVRFDANL